MKLLPHATHRIRDFRVPTLTLGKLMADNGIEQIDLLKLDCEGAEYDIVHSLDREALSRVRCIVAELHPVEGHIPSESIRHLNEMGFEHRYDDCHYFQH